MKKMIFMLLTIMSATYCADATNYYCDPTAGNISNRGTSASPWSTLQAVFEAGKTFMPGDTIFLRNGFHGLPMIKGNNDGYVVIQKQHGHTPAAKKIIASNASRWVISGLNISPEAGGSYDKGDIVFIDVSSNHITLKECNISSAASILGWTQANIADRFGKGIVVAGPDCFITNNLIRQVSFGIEVRTTSTGTNVTYNTIDGFHGDGLRGLASRCKFEYNRVQACYSIDLNHDDGFQSWTRDEAGKSGEGVVSEVEVRGNIFINQVDVNQPFPTTYGFQGIGCFDGFFDNWIVENNIVITDMWHGISFYGARNCRIVNNTVVKNPINLLNKKPWIGVYNHRTRGASTGNIISNNITPGISSTEGSQLSNNILSENYASLFVNWKGYDLHLKTGSPAINAGTTINAPVFDLGKKQRTVTYDAGAYEYDPGSDNRAK